MLSIIKSLTKRQKRVIMLALDSLLIVVSTIAALAVRGLPEHLLETLANYAPVLPPTLIVGVLVSIRLGVCSTQLNAYETAAVGSTAILGTTLAGVSLLGASLLGLDFPLGVASLPEGAVCVADAFNHRLQIFSKEQGAAPRVIGSRGKQPGQFDRPYGVACDGTALYVADNQNNRVQKLRLADGAHLGTAGKADCTRGDGEGLILETAIKHRYRTPMEIVDGLFALSPEEPTGHQLLGDDRTVLVVRV